MGSVILEFSADKYYEAGRAEGRAIGRAKGQQYMADLIIILTSAGKIDDLIRAARDEDFRESLFKKYAIK